MSARALILMIGLWLSSASAWAHTMPEAAVLLDFSEQTVTAELWLPLDQLQLGFGQPLTADPRLSLDRERTALADYIVRHVQPRSPDHRPWRVEVSNLRLSQVDSPTDLVATLRLLPPPGASLRHFTLNYDVITHEVVTDVALVFVRSDWQNAVLPANMELVGTIRYLQTAIAIDRQSGSDWNGMAAALRLGMSHIAEGTDHLLFLIALLLPAPLWVTGRRWLRPRAVRQTLAQLLKVVTAFTVGHTLTLVGAVVFGWRIAAQPVEVLIALSVLLSAIHAWRPLFPGKEPLVAAGFGLVHGLAFASVIAQFGLETREMAQAVVGFNLGVEAMQLAVVVMVAPCLVLLSRTPVYALLRPALAYAAGLASVGWMAERVLGRRNPLADLADSLPDHGAAMVASLIFGTACTLLWHRVVSPRSASQPAKSLYPLIVESSERHGPARDVADCTTLMLATVRSTPSTRTIRP